LFHATLFCGVPSLYYVDVRLNGGRWRSAMVFPFILLLRPVLLCLALRRCRLARSYLVTILRFNTVCVGDGTGCASRHACVFWTVNYATAAAAALFRPYRLSCFSAFRHATPLPVTCHSLYILLHSSLDGFVTRFRHCAARRCRYSLRLLPTLWFSTACGILYRRLPPCFSLLNITAAPAPGRDMRGRANVRRINDTTVAYVRRRR